MIALTAVVAALAVLVLVCLLALVDQYRSLEVVREHLGVNDAPRPIDHRPGPVAPSEVGLPGHLDARGHLVVLLLSTSCATCRTVGVALRGKDHPALHVVVRAAGREEGEAWCAEVGLAPHLVSLDVGGAIASSLGVTVTPAALVLRDHQVVVAQTVPSYRQLEPLLSGRALAGLPPTQQQEA